MFPLRYKTFMQRSRMDETAFRHTSADTLFQASTTKKLWIIDSSELSFVAAHHSIHHFL